MARTKYDGNPWPNRPRPRAALGFKLGVQCVVVATGGGPNWQGVCTVVGMGPKRAHLTNPMYEGTAGVKYECLTIVGSTNQEEMN